MNFFDRQEAARRKTRVLLAYYALAVSAIVCAFYLASRAIAYLALSSLESDAAVRGHSAPFGIFEWNAMWALITAGISLTVIACATLFRRASLAEGGASVARSAGGRELDPATDDTDERRLINVVEEMALASGMPVPRVYVLDDELGINAFAAGFTTRDAAVAVTKGALTKLRREELQGVVAHEFSHIVNGDMRLNSWLIGVLFGILATSVMGRVLMESLRHVRLSGKKGGGGIFLLIFLSGLALWAIGSIGVFFARLIQSCVCRQREYLADASAVQFTRNPLGLAGALKRIGAVSRWTSLGCSNRDELSHLLFSSPTADDFFASHPPLLKRILMLDPAFNGDFRPWCAVEPKRAADREPSAATPAKEPQTAADFMRCLSPELRQSVAQPVGAACALYGLLLSDDADVRRRQREGIASREGMPVAAAAERWRDTFRGRDRTARRMFAELAIAGCRRRDPAGRAVSVALVKDLAAADGSISLFEYMLQNGVVRGLSPTVSLEGFRKLLPPAEVRAEVALVLGTLAYAGQPTDDAAAEAAWRVGAARTTSFGVAALLPVRGSCTLDALDGALERLNGLAPLLKRELLAACSFVVRADGNLDADEAELLRAIADALDMSLPTLTFDGQ